jgi:hypothetical protein
MAMASKPPARIRETSYYVTKHALDRMRERSDRTSACLDDFALALLIDDAVHLAMLTPANVYQVQDDRGEEAQLVYIGPQDWDQSLVSGSLFALIKENDKKDSPRKYSVVTILSEHMGRKRYLGDETGGSINTSLAEQLKGVQVNSDGKQKESVPQSPDYIVLRPWKDDKPSPMTKEEALEEARMDPRVEIYKRQRFVVKVEFA